MKQLGLWLIEQEEINAEYSNYDYVVVVAESREDALKAHSDNFKYPPENIKVIYLGMASKQAVALDRIVLCSSYYPE